MSVDFESWSTEQEPIRGTKRLRLLTLDDDEVETAISDFAAVLPVHYRSPKKVARVLKRLGKTGVAKLVEKKVPKSKRKRSGEVGEIVAAEYIESRTDFATPVKRLRWKDHQEMPMRGDDVIGIKYSKHSKIEFLKAEVKSRKNLDTKTVNEAREALEKNSGLPASDSLAFISDRLEDLGETKLAEAIDIAQLVDGISSAQITQMIFTLSGNSPDYVLKTDLNEYKGTVKQFSVGFRVESHQNFVKSVYERALEKDER